MATSKPCASYWSRLELCFAERQDGQDGEQHFHRHHQDGHQIDDFVDSKNISGPPIEEKVAPKRKETQDEGNNHKTRILRLVSLFTCKAWKRNTAVQEQAATRQKTRRNTNTQYNNEPMAIRATSITIIKTIVMISNSKIFTGYLSSLTWQEKQRHTCKWGQICGSGRIRKNTTAYTCRQSCRMK